MDSLIIMVSGATGFLGSHLVSKALERGMRIVSLARRSHKVFAGLSGFRETLNNSLVSESFIASAFEHFKPHCFIHMAAASSPSRCESFPEEADLINIKYSQLVIKNCERFRIPFYFVSTDLVFEGLTAPQGGLSEEVQPMPLSRYGRAKFQIEQETLALEHGAAVLRSSLQFGEGVPGARSAEAWLHQAFRAEDGRGPHLFFDEWRTPVYVGDVAEALLALAIRSESGVFHAAGPERLTREELGRHFAQYYQYPTHLIRSISRKDGNPLPARAEDVSLNARRTEEVLGIRFRAPSAHYSEFHS